MSFLRQQLLFIGVAFLSACIGVYIGWGDAFTLKKFYLYIGYNKVLFAVLFNYAIIQLFFIATGRQYTALILSQIFVMFLNFINQKKQQYLFSNLSPEDVFLLPEAMKASPWSLQLIFFILIALFLVVLVIAIRKEEKTTIHSYVPNTIIFFFISSSLIYLNFIMNPTGACQREDRPAICNQLADFPNTRNDWVGDYRKIQNYGFSTFYISKILDQVTDRLLPRAQVSEQVIQDILHQNPGIKGALADDAIKPNIVIIMQESFWDPRHLDQALGRNLLPFFQKNQISQLISPSFGGGTANVEFEVLTSLNTAFFPNELLYVSKVKRPIYALPFYLDGLGYQTIAMHNNYGYYYNRNKVYPALGFQQFISLENMVSQEKRPQIFNAGGWATDVLIYENIKKVLQQGDQPKFIYAITVENHPMYNDDRYGKQQFKFSKTLSELNQRKLSTYTAGVARADQKLSELTAYLKTLKQPTIVLVFGDHLPNLQGVYDEYDYFKNDPERTALKNYQTPLAIWSNFPIQKKVLQQESVPSSFVASKLLQVAGLPLSPYYHFMQRLSGCYAVIHPKFLMPASECKHDAKQLLEQYKNINQNTLSGENYLYGLSLTPDKTAEIE
ncbi:LTA synthase family protein [Acinetobacter ursingii]|uniref:LTA synthase family protein n=2 Tax=Acinetobacter ursingii TaxID=108980 RepID=UPI0021CDBC9E|nr:LTA synthase family protein [Acinetobacter ursingii]MCU4306294.1 LTA synthase family protein [Acinetobacter ursingii]MCU4371835.1 LTA synthase family protein [Acinetobacter ursingii]MDG9992969.1 LTA synthase family protein [Acinetobacter ursingii]MDH0203778.1 LTA synthase family protein [Acinetobacter ursingii]